MVQREQLKLQIAFERQWLAWIYRGQQEEVMISTAELEESLQVVLLSYYMATKGPVTVLLGCQSLFSMKKYIKCQTAWNLSRKILLLKGETEDYI